MEHNPDRDRWRPKFCCGLQLIGRASARLPYGVAEPVLHGASAVELYTGSLWASADLVLLASDARILNAELMAEGFRWGERPSNGSRGLWHPALELDVHVADGPPFGAAEQSNILTVDLGGGASLGGGAVNLRVVGIEDLIAAEVRGWVSQGATDAEAATRVDVLAGLARAGVGGRLRGGYLQRRLAHETDGAIVLDPSLARSVRDDPPARMTTLAAMQAVIRTWRLQCGLSFGPRRMPSSARPARNQTGRDRQGRGGRSSATSNVIHLDACVPVAR